jgi:hypothetical protein
MRLRAILVICLFPAGSCLALTPQAEEFMRIARELEPVHCEKRKLRREITLAEVEKRGADVRALRARFTKLDRDPKTARLEKRLGELESMISDGKGGTRDPEDLAAISKHQRDAYYRCE